MQPSPALEQFGAQFEKDLLAVVIQEPSLFNEICPLIDANGFRVEDIKRIWQTGKKLLEKCGEFASLSILLRAFSKEYSDEETGRLLSMVQQSAKRRIESRDVLREQVIEYVRERRSRKAFESSAKFVLAGNYLAAHHAYEAIMADCPTGQAMARKPQEWHANFSIRQDLRRERKFNPDLVSVLSTGIPELDESLGGGMRPGDLVALQGVTGVGKSALALSISAACMESQIGVLFLPTEMTAEENFTRMDTRFLQYDSSRFRDYDFSEEDLKVIKRRHERLAEFKDYFFCVDIPSGRPTRSQILRHIKWGKEHIKNFGAVVVDCVHHIEPPKQFRGNELAGQESNAYWLKDVLKQEQVVGIVTAQANRSGATWTDTETVAGTYGLVRACDAVIAINRQQEPEGLTEKIGVAANDRSIRTTMPPRPGMQAMILTACKTRSSSGKRDVFVWADLARMTWSSEADFSKRHTEQSRFSEAA